MVYARNANTQATAVLYTIENIAHHLLFVSSAMLAMVAMHGKNSRMNIMNDIAERGVKSPETLMSSFIPSSEFPLYSTPNVLTTSSLAGMLVMIAVLARQLRPKGFITGSMK